MKTVSMARSYETLSDLIFVERKLLCIRKIKPYFPCLHSQHNLVANSIRFVKRTDHLPIKTVSHWD